MTTILIVDDDVGIRRTFRALLEGEGYAVRLARNAEDALAKVAEARPDLVLLDVMMPGRNGFAVCEDIRRRDKILPILFLTAVDGEADQVRAFGAGADDYVLKTVSDAELLARVRRALNRVTDYAASEIATTQIRLGAVLVDFKRSVIRDGKTISSMTATEAGLLRCLYRNRGELCTPEALFAFLRGEGCVGESATLRMHVMNLRRKLGRAGDQIVTVPNGGYYLVR